MGSPLSAFSQFVLDTPAIYLTDAKSVIVEAQKRTYFLSRLLQGDHLERIQGGQKIKDVIIFDDASTMTDYQPNDTFTYQMPQVQTQHAAPWRFTMDHASWTDHEEALNEGITMEAKKAEYKKLKETIYARAVTSMMNGFENRLWASPHGQKAEMESDSGRTPYSIPALLNEETNGLPYGWTTVEQVNPATESNWKPTKVLYDYNDPVDLDGSQNGLLDAFEDMLLRLTWNPPKWEEGKRYFEKPGDERTRVIACSRYGMTLFKYVCRERNDRLISVNNPAIPGINFNGIDLEYVNALDSAALYATGSAGTYNTETASATTTQGPRYYWLDARYLKFFVHGGHFMDRKVLPKNMSQPFTNVMIWDTWWNLFCRSRKRLGIISPGASGSSSASGTFA